MSNTNKTMIAADVVSSEELIPDIYSLVIKAPEIADKAVFGQFVSLYTDDGAHLLPRPISICDIDNNKGIIRLVYRIAGYGTKCFSELRSGDTVRVMGPLGNGFSADDILEYTNSHPSELTGEVGNNNGIILIGGGIGIPPMLCLAKGLYPHCKNITAVLGYRNSDTFLVKEFEKCTERVVIASDDGSIGTHGTVIDAIREMEVSGSVICACGPTPMLRGVKELASDMGVPAYISLEERMACGIGACLACVCKTKDVDDHSKVNNARICADGPVFRADEVEI